MHKVTFGSNKKKIIDNNKCVLYIIDHNDITLEPYETMHRLYSYITEKNINIWERFKIGDLIYIMGESNNIKNIFYIDKNTCDSIDSVMRSNCIIKNLLNSNLNDVLKKKNLDKNYYKDIEISGDLCDNKSLIDSFTYSSK